MTKNIKLIAAASILSLFSYSSFAFAAPAPITQYSLEDLMNAEVTSVSRKAEPLSKTAAAIYVINQEDIRRSTATKVPELLKNVPGLEVAQINADNWAITARGFNGTLTNKLLVMIDGRTVYSHLHNGVYWDVQDLVLEDIERIEVIRGPGASTWGANAMNGVINIITKNANKTQGALLSGWGGSEEQGAAARFGGKAGENVAYRGSGKFINSDSSFKGNDAWEMARGSFRTDWKAREKDNVTVQGDYYNGDKDEQLTETLLQAPFRQVRKEDSELSGGDVLARWNHTYSATSDSSLQIYYDQTNRQNIVLDEIRYTADIDWQHRFQANEKNEIVWGLNTRLLADRTKGSIAAYFDPSSRADELYQAFLQDTISLVPSKLWLTLGSRFEINPYSGFEFQPTARISWQPYEKHLIWAAVSRAVRTPSRLDHDLVIQGWLTPGSNMAQVLGNPKSQSESMIAYELGYRAQLHERFLIDVAGFYNNYSRLRTLNYISSYSLASYNVTQYAIDNDAQANTFGAEIEAKWKPVDRFNLGAGYTFLKMFVDSHNDTFNTAEMGEDQNPKNQIFLHPSFDLPHDVEIDAYIRHIDALKNIHVPSYWESDLRLGWRPVPYLQLALIGQNLFHNHHQEFALTPEIQRSVYGKATVEF